LIGMSLPPWSGLAIRAACRLSGLKKYEFRRTTCACNGDNKVAIRASSPGTRSSRRGNEEKRRVLETGQVVQQTKQGETFQECATERAGHNESRPAIQIAPLPVERKTGGHIKSTWGPSGPQDARNVAIRSTIFAARGDVLSRARATPESE